MPAFPAAWLLAAATLPNSPATLIVFRDGAEPLLLKPVITVDGVELGRLGEKRFFAVELPAGTYRIEARWPALAGHRPVSASVKIGPGGYAALELTGRAAFWKTRAATGLMKQDVDEALARLKICCRQAN